MKEKLAGFVLISLFFIQFYMVTSSNEFVCYKSANTCYVKKFFYDNQILATYDLDKIEKLNWKWEYRRKYRYQQVYMMYKTLDNDSVSQIKLLKTDFASDKIAAFNEYQKNNEETFKFKDLQLFLIITTIFSMVFFIPAGVFLLKNGKFEIR